MNPGLDSLVLVIHLYTQESGMQLECLKRFLPIVRLLDC